jgi:hypothetical protein
LCQEERRHNFEKKRREINQEYSKVQKMNENGQSKKAIERLLIVVKNLESWYNQTRSETKLLLVQPLLFLTDMLEMARNQRQAIERIREIIKQCYCTITLRITCLFRVARLASEIRENETATVAVRELLQTVQDCAGFDGNVFREVYGAKITEYHLVDIVDQLISEREIQETAHETS